MCSHYLYIYQAPSQWQPFLISSYQFLEAYRHIVPCCVSASLPPTPKQSVAVVVVYILRTFATKLSIVTLVCAMFADNLGIYNVCETAACHDLHGAPEPSDALAGGIAFYATSANTFAIYLCLASHPLVSFFYRLSKKNATCSLQNIYFSYFCLLIIS